MAAGSVAGVKEGQGPMCRWFDFVSADDTFGQETWEQAESKMLKTAINIAIENSGFTDRDVDLIISGDLLNQLMASSFMARDLKLPFLGVYGACSAMTESLLLAAALTDGGYFNTAVNSASSHFSTAERQFRNPLEHGNQKPPYAQSTVVGAGAMVVSGKASGGGVRVAEALVGRVIDASVKDPNQMGPAMAPAAVDTIITYFNESGRNPDDFDLILTGDLGFTGREIALDMLKGLGVASGWPEGKFQDCGAMIYNKEPGLEGGGSGCGCSASVLAGFVYKKMKAGEFKRILALSTGALLSTISSFQGESIPGIAHAVVLESEGGK